MTTYIILVLLTISANVSANVILKYYVMSPPPTFLQQFFQPLFWVALGFWGLNMLFYTRALQYAPVAVVYSTLVGATVILLSLISWFFFKDALSFQKCLGIALILLGVFAIYWK